MRSAFRRAQLAEARDFVLKLAAADDKTLYPEMQQRLLGVAYLLSAVADELGDWNNNND